MPAIAIADESTPRYFFRECDFVELVNDARADEGLPPVTINLDLTQAADHHAYDMARTGWYKADHTLSDGTTARQNIVNHGYPLRPPFTYQPGFTPYYGEIMTAGPWSAESAFRAFWYSPSHKAIILNPKMKAIGVSRAQGWPSVRYPWYWVATFGGVTGTVWKAC